MAPALNLDTLRLDRGAHKNLKDGMCIMEAVAYIANEPWSDHPECASPTIAAFMRRWNDDLPDDDRQTLKPYITRLVNSRGTPQQEDQRGWMAADWMIRTYLPLWLHAAGLHEQAENVEELPPVTNRAVWQQCRPTLKVVRDVTWPLRTALYEKVRAAVRTKLNAAAVAAVAAAADAAAAAAVADVADAVAVAAAAAVADVVAAAAAVAAGAAAVAAAAAAAAGAAADYWSIREAVYTAVCAALDAELGQVLTSARASAIELLEQLLAVTGS